MALPPPAVVLSPPGSAVLAAFSAGVAATAAAAVADAAGGSGRVGLLLHAFSNGGLCVVAALAATLPPALAARTGVLVDSAPAAVTLVSVARAMGVARGLTAPSARGGDGLGGRNGRGGTAPPTAVAATAAAAAAARTATAWVAVAKDTAGLFVRHGPAWGSAYAAAFVKMPAWSGGEVYVFGTADAQAPAAGVEAHVAARRAVYAAARGGGGGRNAEGVVTTIPVGASAHVRHAAASPEAYARAMAAVVEGVAAAVERADGEGRGTGTAAPRVRAAL